MFGRPCGRNDSLLTSILWISMLADGGLRIRFKSEGNEYEFQVFVNRNQHMGLYRVVGNTYTNIWTV